MRLVSMSGKIAAYDVWNILGIPPDRRAQDQNSRMGEAMRKLGWERGNARFNGKVEKCYRKGTKLEREKHELMVTGMGDHAMVTKRGRIGG